MNLLGAVTWGFEFEEQAWYAGFRDMATNGVDKPVLNTFRMFGMMEGTRVAVDQEGLNYGFEEIRDSSVRRAEADVNALAAKTEDATTVLVWNYHDDDNLDVPATPVKVQLSGMPEDGRLLLTHFRIDQEHSNSYTAWKAMGSPQNPTEAQIGELEAAGQLDLFGSPQWVNVKGGSATVEMLLPRQGISLLKWSRP